MHTRRARTKRQWLGAYFVGIIGLLMLLAAFSKPIRHLQRYFLLSMVLLAPLVVGFFIGAYASLSIAFTGCFSGVCSPNLNMFGAYGPIVVFVALFALLSVAIYKKRSAVMNHVDRIKAPIWIVVGLLVISFAILKTNIELAKNAETNQIRKSNLSRYM